MDILMVFGTTDSGSNPDGPTSNVGEPMDFVWLILIAAGFMEPVWVYTMERSDDFKDIRWTAATAVIMIVDLYLLSVAMRSIGAGMSYAVWTGIGAVATFLMGILLFKESLSWKRVLCIFVIIGGIVGLNLVTGGTS